MIPVTEYYNKKKFNVGVTSFIFPCTEDKKSQFFIKLENKLTSGISSSYASFEHT